MAADVESDVLDKLTGWNSWTENTNLFRGPVLPHGAIGDTYPIPMKAAFVRMAASTPPVIHGSDNLQSKEWIVDVVYRSAPQQYGTGRSDAQAILDRLNDNPPTGYIDARAEMSSPMWLEQDDTGCHYFVVSVRYRKLEA